MATIERPFSLAVTDDEDARGGHSPLGIVWKSGQAERRVQEIMDHTGILV